MDGDDGRVDPVAVAADRTLTIGLVKRGLLLPPGRDFAGEIEVADIGFADAVCARHAGREHWLTRGDCLELLPPRRSWAHKYQCGTVLVVAGSRAFGGAAHLAGLGALRSGAGLVTMLVPESLEVPVRVGLPEAIVAAVPETEAGTIAPLDTEAFGHAAGGAPGGGAGAGPVRRPGHRPLGGGPALAAWTAPAWWTPTAWGPSPAWRASRASPTTRWC